MKFIDKNINIIMPILIVLLMVSTILFGEYEERQLIQIVLISMYSSLFCFFVGVVSRCNMFLVSFFKYFSSFVIMVGGLYVLKQMCGAEFSYAIYKIGVYFLGGFLLSIITMSYFLLLNFENVNLSQLVSVRKEYWIVSIITGTYFAYVFSNGGVYFLQYVFFSAWCSIYFPVLIIFLYAIFISKKGLDNER